MKKSGFTLAEVLITLGIVGVVSALVLPTFTTKMQTAKVGPRLAKAVASLEQANIAIRNDAQADSLSGAFIEYNGNSFEVLQAVKTYFAALKTHMKGSFKDGLGGSSDIFYAADGVSYCFAETDGLYSKCLLGSYEFEVGNNSLPHLNPITSQNHKWGLMIDIDGDNGPAKVGRDQFFFQMMEDGSLRPWGGSWEPDEGSRWKKSCPENTTPPNSDYIFCAGHIMENGLKVEYK